MAQPNFDPGGFYEFDLSRGAVRAKGGERVFVMSNEVVTAVLQALTKQNDFATLRTLGASLATHASSSLAGKVAESTPEEVIGHASAVLGLYGWGKLSAERWGDALVVSLSGMSDLDPKQTATAALLTGLLSKLANSALECVPVGIEKLIVVHPSIAKDVAGWVAAGSDLAAVSSQLVAKEGA